MRKVAYTIVSLVILATVVCVMWSARAGANYNRAVEDARQPSPYYDDAVAACSQPAE